MKPLKILSMPVDDGGCGWYRIRQPFDMINRFTEHETHVWDAEGDDPVELMKAGAIADVAVVRQGGEQAIDYFKTIPEFRHLKWVLDIDDNIEIISPYSQHYQEYGTQEFYDPALGKWLWKDGEQGFNLAKNRDRVASLLNGMRKADMVSVTTPTLAKYARTYNPNVRVLPNSVAPDKWWKLNLKPNKTLRVGWHGGVSHYEDWYSIREPLNRLMREYQFHLVMVGSHYGGVIDDDNKHLVEILPWVPFEAHSYRMMCMALDIALIPLADLPFNAYKSPIKWCEMSAMCVPSVVSNITPYKEAIQDGKTALGYRTPNEFYAAVKVLIETPALRTKIGHAADHWVQEHANARTNATLWTDAYSSLLTNK